MKTFARWFVCLGVLGLLGVLVLDELLKSLVTGTFGPEAYGKLLGIWDGYFLDSLGLAWLSAWAALANHPIWNKTTPQEALSERP